MRQKQEESMCREPDYFIHPAFAAGRPVQPFEAADAAPPSFVERLRIALLRLKAEGRHGRA